jgi:hypothetical protein
MTHLLLNKPCPYAINGFPERTWRQAMLTEKRIKVLFDCTVILSNNYHPPFPVGSLIAHARGGMAAGNDKRYLSDRMSGICLKWAYTISRLINDMLKNVVLRNMRPCCPHLTLRMGTAYPSDTLVIFLSNCIASRSVGRQSRWSYD